MLAHGLQDIREASYSFLQCISLYFFFFKEPCDRKKSITDKLTLSLVFEIP